MLCPICNLDLSPLDQYSRQEHCEICLENGPSILDTDETGQLVIKRNVAPGKQRKICPICDKTFQNLNHHFKTCAIKNDVPPHLMLEYWDKINVGCKNARKFPRELLDNFVTKCIKEGRLGEQVDLARALSLSMAESEPQTSSTRMTGTIQQVDGLGDSNQELPPATGSSLNINQEPMIGAKANQRTAAPKPAIQKKYRLEIVDDTMKKANISLRLERELAATSSRRYEEALEASRQLGEHCDNDVEILEDTETCDTSNLDKLFFRARLKDCSFSEDCLRGTCEGHELVLLMDEFQKYAGASMFANPSGNANRSSGHELDTYVENLPASDNIDPDGESSDYSRESMHTFAAVVEPSE